MLYSTPYIIVKKKMQGPVEIAKQAALTLYIGLFGADPVGSGWEPSNHGQGA
jgi:hypothetical protein